MVIDEVDDEPGVDAPAPSPTVLHQQHFTKLVRTAALMVNDRFVAEEIVQEAFAQLVSRWDRISPPKAVGYLYRSVSNGAKSTLRRRQTSGRYRPEPEATEPAAETAALKASGYDALLAAVAALPVRQRQVLVLRYFNDFSINETAEALGTSETAVTAATHRAVQALSEHREDFR